MGVFFKNDAWWIDYRDHKGKRHRQKVGPKKKAEETLIRIRSKVLTGEFVDPEEEKRREKQNPLFRDYANEYLEWSKANKARRSYERDITSIKVHLLGVFAGLRLEGITRKMVEDYKTRRKDRDGANVATVNRELCCLKSMLRKATEWGYVGENITAGIKQFRERPKTPRHLEKEEVARLLEECLPHIYAFVATAVYTGLRRSELLHLEWSDVDFKKRTITVRNKDDWHTKNYENRTIPMNDALYEALREHPRHFSSPYVFCNPDNEGKPLQDFRCSFETACKRAGLGHVVFHSLRHTFASHLVMSGVDLTTVQRLLGHKDIKTTMRYSHLAPDHLKGAVERLDFSSGHYMDTKASGEEKDA